MPGPLQPIVEIPKSFALASFVFATVVGCVIPLQAANAADVFDAGVRRADAQKQLPAREQIDQIDAHTGNLLVRHVDLTWKGNGGLDIEIHRNYDLRSSSAGLKQAVSSSFRWAQLGAGWTMLVAPRWVEQKMRPGPLEPQQIVTDLSRFCSGTTFPNAGEAFGPFIEFPNGDRDSLIPLGNGRAVTKGNWRAECVANKITLRSPDGLAYDLGW